jgi:hypothetical protein
MREVDPATERASFRLVLCFRLFAHDAIIGLFHAFSLLACQLRQLFLDSACRNNTAFHYTCGPLFPAGTRSFVREGAEIGQEASSVFWSIVHRTGLLLRKMAQVRSFRFDQTHSSVYNKVSGDGCRPPSRVIEEMNLSGQNWTEVSGRLIIAR